MCRKLETEEEKVLPFYASSLTQEEQDDVNTAVAEPPSQPLAAVSTVFDLITAPALITAPPRLFIYFHSLSPT